MDSKVIIFAMNVVDELHHNFQTIGKNYKAKKATEEFAERLAESRNITNEDLILVLSHVDTICKCNW